MENLRAGTVLHVYFFAKIIQKHFFWEEGSGEKTLLNIELKNSTITRPVQHRQQKVCFSFSGECNGSEFIYY